MVSIIILSYNTSSLIADCLTSVYTYCKDVPFEIIVVDNNSYDQSVHIIKTRFPKVRLIESDENLGFAKGVNLGASHAKGDMLLFLNSDTQFSDDSLIKMVTFLKSAKDEKIGIVGGKLINKGKSTSSSYNDFYTLPQVFSMLFLKGEKKKKIQTPTQVDWVSGGFMLIWKDVFEKVKGFDGKYFMYIEDMDLCYRLLKKGYTTSYFPQASVAHIGQGSSNRGFAIIQIYKGLLYFYKKHMPRWQYAVVRGMLILKGSISLILGILRNDTYLKTTYSSALKHIL